MELLIVAVLRGYETEKIVAEVFETDQENIEKDTLAAMARIQREGYKIEAFSITKL